MIYCDTSLLMAALTVEPLSSRAQQWLADHSASGLCTSHWTTTEFSSALALKVRRGDMPQAERPLVLSNWRQLLAAHLAVLPVPDEAFDLAARYCDLRGARVRAGDALHLAVASLAGHPLATLDKTMAEAALALGLVVEAA